MVNTGGERERERAFGNWCRRWCANIYGKKLSAWPPPPSLSPVLDIPAELLRIDFIYQPSHPGGQQVPGRGSDPVGTRERVSRTFWRWFSRRKLAVARLIRPRRPRTVFGGPNRADGRFCQRRRRLRGSATGVVSSGKESSWPGVPSPPERDECLGEQKRTSGQTTVLRKEWKFCHTKIRNVPHSTPQGLWGNGNGWSIYNNDDNKKRKIHGLAAALRFLFIPGKEILAGQRNVPSVLCHLGKNGRTVFK